tara:strand:- start:3178 stop:3300 length:123 start_codon:yes stop_codon:yes gene_type:complete
MTPIGGSAGHGDKTHGTFFIINRMMATLGFNFGEIRKNVT